MGGSGTSACDCETDSFLDLKQKLLEEAATKADTKQQKTSECEVDAVSTVLDVKPKIDGASKMKMTQQSLHASMQSATAVEVDIAIAEFFFGCNLPPNTVDHPLFKKMAAVMKSAPASHVPPERHRLTGDLLDSTVQRLKAEEAPLRDVILKDSGTVVSDGWDDVGRNHLINFLVGTSKGMFFDGTVKLSSTDSEDAKRVAELIIAEIEQVGPTLVIQVVTDTCSVMKAAWKLIEEKFPWITCTCCGPHVLSLMLNDLGKIKEVAAVIKKVGRVLNRFWGRTRWARTRLREVAAVNHGKQIGLYRAKQTRFAGKVREMARMLRLKADLRQVADSAAYASQKWTLTKKEKEAAAAVAAGEEEEEEEEEEEDGIDPIKKVLFDEDEFWKPLVAALKVCQPSRNCTHGVLEYSGIYLPALYKVRTSSMVAAECVL